MKYKLIISLICFLLLLNLSFTQQRSSSYGKYESNIKIEFENGQFKFIPIIKLNDKDYFNLSKNYQNLFFNSTFNADFGSIRFENLTITVSALSFYVVKDSANFREIYQMNLPVLSIKNDLLIPIKPFLQSLEFFRIYKIDYVNSNHVRVNRFYQQNYFTSKPSKIDGNKNSIYESSDTESKMPPVKVERNQNNTNDVFKINQDTSKPDFQPNQYKLPPTLFRKDIIPKHKKEQIDTSGVELNKNNFKSEWEYSDLYASVSIFIETSKIQFNLLRYDKVSENQIDLILTADNIISTYHKPELKDGKLILRIPDAVNAIKNIKNINIPGFRSGIEVEYIRNFLLYKLTPVKEIDSLFSRRNGTKEIIYSICFKGFENEKIIDSSVIAETPNFGDKWKLDVIVIDPGHGGEDPGAISISGYKEKDLTLSIALELRKLINEHLTDVKVVMTREDDRFVELYKRGKIANQANGKLFISIHLNSMPKKPHSSNGFETYILRPGRNEDAIRVAEKENSVIKYEKDQSKYKDFDDESIILATIAQSGFQKLSELFAKIIQSEVGKTTPMKNRGVNQAGFYVLVGASMPNVLFEGGFLSNKEDEKFITSKDGQKKIALGLFNAVNRYIAEYESLIHSENR